MKQDPSAPWLAACLLQLEAEERVHPGELADATERICARLHQQFTRLVGSAGCDLLMARAVAIATVECPRLNGIRWDRGSAAGLQGLYDRLDGCPPDEARQACAAILGAFLSLLGNFIGADLTARQLQRMWPELPAYETRPEATE